MKQNTKSATFTRIERYRDFMGIENFSRRQKCKLKYFPNYICLRDIQRPTQRLVADIHQSDKLKTIIKKVT